MEKNITIRVFRIVSIVLILLAAVFIILIWSQSETAMREDTVLQGRILNPYFITAYVALGTCILLALIFPIFNIVTQPKNTKRVLIGLGALVLIGIVSFAMSGNEFDALQLRALNITETASRQIGAALIGTYIIAGASVLAILYAEISNYFKK